MALSSDQLKLLYERVVHQSVYPGGVCPAEHVLVKYESDELGAAEKQVLEEHFAQCSLCRQDYIALGRAGQWFRRHESEILAGLAAKGAAGGVLPWAHCPSPALLWRYVAGEVPDTPGGKALLAEFDRHVRTCPDCARLVERFRGQLDAPQFSLRDLAANVGLTILDKLRGFFDALTAAAQVAGSPVVARGAPGFRGRGEDEEEGALLKAPVLAADGAMVVSPEGEPRVCRLQLLQARVQSDGFLTVRLATSEKEYFADAQSPYEVALAIRAGGVCVALPAVQIDEDGRATFTGMLPQAAAVDPLPVTALDVTVRPQAPQPTTG